MARRSLAIPAVAGLVLAIACAGPQAPPVEGLHASPTLAEAKAAAIGKGVPVLVDFWSPT